MSYTPPPTLQSPFHPQILHTSRTHNPTPLPFLSLRQSPLNIPPKLRIQHPNKHIDAPHHQRRNSIQHARPCLRICILETRRKQEAQPALDCARDEQAPAQPQVYMRRDYHPRVRGVELVVEDLGRGLQRQQTQQYEANDRVIVVELAC